MEESLGAGFGQRIFDAIAPLTFVALYKVLDMVYEWILEENKGAGVIVISQVPWQFEKKVQVLSSASIQYPPLFVAKPYLHEYSYRLYTLLLPYRNEIVHKHNVSVKGDTIIVTSSRTGTTLCLNGEKQAQLVRFVVSTAQCLTTRRAHDDFLEILLRYHLDQLAFIHRLPVFNQRLPLLVNVELTVPEEGGCFRVALNFVRERVARIHPHSTVLFNLKVIGIRGDSVVAVWDLPVTNVPSSDIFELNLESYPEYRSQ